jgi:acyl carrier protein
MKDIILKYVIEEFGNKDLNKITYDTSLISEGYIDSFSMISILMFLQNTFNIKISNKDAIPSNFDSVIKMTDLVNKYKL